MRIILAALACAGSLFAQMGSPVNQTAGGPPVSYLRLIFPDGSGNPQYICFARSVSKQTTVTVSGATNANPVVFTATAHNFGDYATLGATIEPVVKITGGTGNWAAVNGVWKATPTSANAFSIPVNSTSLGSFSGQTLTVTTVAPRTNETVWGIQYNTFDGSGNTTSTSWAGMVAGAGNSSLTGSNTAEDKACSSRASYAYQ